MQMRWIPFTTATKTFGLNLGLASFASSSLLLPATLWGHDQGSHDSKHQPSTEAPAASAATMSTTTNAAKTDLKALYSLPKFELENASLDKSFTNADLKGHYWVVSFFFSKCQHVCPFILGKVVNLQAKHKDHRNLRFASITSDPAHDQKAVLKDYAKKFKADPDRWYFLTGKPEAIVGLVRDGFKLSISLENPSFHSAKFALVDGAGQVLGYYDSDDAKDLEHLDTILRSLDRPAS